MPEPRHGRVYVPTVGANGSGLLTIDCQLRGDDSPQRWMASGLGIDPAVLETILTESRDGETGPQALAKVRISVHPRAPVGNSLGLGVALADRIARMPPKTPAGILFASGVVLTNGRGQLGPVEGFREKVELIAKVAPAGATFVYYRQNEADAKDTFERLKAGGQINLRPADHLEELSDLWENLGQGQTPAAAFGRWRRPSIYLAGTALAVVVIVLCSIGIIQYRKSSALHQLQASIRDLVHARRMLADDFPTAVKLIHTALSPLDETQKAAIRKFDPTLLGLERMAAREVNVRNTDIAQSDQRIHAYTEAARLAFQRARPDEQIRRWNELVTARQSLTQLDLDRNLPAYEEAERAFVRLSAEAYAARSKARMLAVQKVLQNELGQAASSRATFAKPSDAAMTPREALLLQSALARSVPEDDSVAATSGQAASN